MARYLALLRGINVGGKNLIRMTELAACLGENGLSSVTTYIASGNVLFEARDSSAVALTLRLEKVLAETFSYRASVVLLDRRQLRRIVARAPDGFGRRPALERAGTGGRGPGQRGPGCAVLLSPRSPRRGEPAGPGRLDAHLPEHDHPQLEHHHPVAGADGER